MPDETVQSTDETRGSATATTGIAADTQTGATTRTEATSTRTYAPDNYDRTLMRLPSEDASKLFAGMKSDSDVVMTPEYAKKVFHSKSSAQRLQHYKFYGGIAIVIMLAIGIFGLFEYQNQSANIDASLRPLKRDPMPGIIRPEKEADNNGLFSGTEIDERTIDLIESAENADDEIVPDTGVIAEDTESEPEVVAADSTSPPEAAAEIETVAQTRAATTTVSQPEAVSEAPSQARQDTSTAAAEEPATMDEVASSAQPVAEDSAVDDSSASLKISSGERVEQKSIWLREAYAAYQAGNDESAMSLYNKVLELDPRNRNALLARAAIHVQNNNSQDAIRDYQALLLVNPKDSLAMASLLAIANYSPQDSETQLKLMLRAEPDSPYLNFALANAYGAQNRWQEAQSFYFKALENNPGDPNYAYNLAVSLEHIAQPRAAVSYYRRALDNFGNGLATFSREVVDQRLKMLGKL
jgi:Flp pilus assembly protein TadD